MHQVDARARDGQHGVQRLGLGEGARKAVEDRAAGAFERRQALLDQADDDLVGDQLAVRP